ncbi:AI-2E family transporter [Kamptonema sp. UHCC 0994]|uniref:AI-2E family transporter n=1 Tax=Kamptonema sp. UHCC 0994 TaxID=3031329 RepID=UPI0023B9D09C|nr:AI-2E family transporter [Kamptonema sp. UHCC 0994]MDF0554832.1 AI-2E family transporter [Kamptonema sp. UHCC 0994]
MNFGQWLGLVALILSLSILWEIRQLLLLLFVAVVFAIALNRLVRLLGRVGIKRGVASLISSVGLLALIGLFGGLVVPPFLSQFKQLTQLVPQGLILLENLINQLFVWLPTEARQYLPSVGELGNQVQPLVSGLANNFFRLFSGFLNLTGGSLFVIVITIMLLLNPQAYRQGFLRLFPSFYRRRANEIFSLCETDLVAWIVGTLFNMLVIGSVSGIILQILGVKLVLANALLAGFLEAVPNVGPVLSTVAPAAIALLDSPWKALAVVISYFLIQQLEQFLLVPIVMGQQVSLLPAVTLLAQIFFASFFGFLGLFLALPLVIIVRILIREILVKDVLDRWEGNVDWESKKSGEEEREKGGERETGKLGETEDFPPISN